MDNQTILRSCEECKKQFECYFQSTQICSFCSLDYKKLDMVQELDKLNVQLKRAKSAKSIVSINDKIQDIELELGMKKIE